MSSSSLEICSASCWLCLGQMANVCRGRSWKSKLIVDRKTGLHTLTVARRTKRTETMYRAGGVAYVYFVYGMYYQFNVVSNVEDIPHAILVRALEPVEGIEIMRARRHSHPDHNLTNGPGKLCIAMGIDRQLDGADLLGDQSLARRIRERFSTPHRHEAQGSASTTLKSGSISPGASGSRDNQLRQQDN